MGLGWVLFECESRILNVLSTAVISSVSLSIGSKHFIAEKSVL